MYKRFQSVVSISLGVLAGAASVPAQDAFRLISVSNQDAARVEAFDGEIQAVQAGDVIEEGFLIVSGSEEAMLLNASGMVAVIRGPARVRFDADDAGNGRIVLVDGRLKLAVGTAPDDASPWTVAAVAPGGDQGFAVVANTAEGMIYLSREGARVDLAFVGAANSSLTIHVDADALELDSGDVLTVENLKRTTADAGPWIASSFDVDSVHQLGLASAQLVRADVGNRLFESIISWDKRGGAKYVKPKIVSSGFRLEIRQVAISTTTAQQTSSQTARISRTQSFPGANEVPLLSPAALSVLNLADGVTVILLNRQARGLLQANGSQGLGFRGPSLLAIPGFGPGGIRTLGPAGLGAQ